MNLKKLAFLLIALAIGLGAGALVLELLVRVVIGSPQAERMPLVRVRPDREAGWTMIPNDVHYTYDIEVRLNSLGFRGGEVLDKQPDEYRILAVGDSHIYGQGVPDESLLTRVAEQKLQDRIEAGRVRVINLGVQDYSTNQELATTRQVGLALEPDHIVLFFYLNDFEPTNIDWRFRKFQDQDWYMMNLAGKPEGRRLAGWKRVQLLRKSALLMWANDYVRGLRAGDVLERRILRGDDDAELERKIADALVELDRFVETARGHDIPLTLAVIPFASQVKKDYPAERYQSTLREYAARRGVEYLDLLPALRDDYSDRGRVPVIAYDGHYDAHGQQVMGDAVAGHLTDAVVAAIGERRPVSMARGD